MNESLRLNYVNQLAGVFVLATILALLLFVLYLVQVKELFAGKLPYEVIITQGELDGIRQGTEVYILGQQVGSVEHISYYQGTSRVKLLLAIRMEAEDEIFDDSELALRRKFGVGEPYLEIMRGPDSKRVLRHDDPQQPVRLPRFVPDEDKLNMLAEKIKNIEQAMLPVINDMGVTARNTNVKLDDSVGPAFDEFRKGSESFGRSASTMAADFRQTLDRVQRSADTLDRNVDSIGRSTDDITADSHETLASFRRTSESVSEQFEKIEGNASKTLERISASADRVGQAAEQARGLVESLNEPAEELPETVQRFNHTVDDAQEVLTGLKRHWLLRRYVDEEAGTQPLSTSGVR